MRTLIKRGSDDTISEGDCIDPRGLGTQLFSAASPNQVIKFNAYAYVAHTYIHQTVLSPVQMPYTTMNST